MTADVLFASANDERQRGAYAEAIRLYRDLSQQFPQSAEATAAHAIVGRLLLDRGDPAGALVQFDEYVQSGRPRSEKKREWDARWRSSASVGRPKRLTRGPRFLRPIRSRFTLLARGRVWLL